MGVRVVWHVLLTLCCMLQTFRSSSGLQLEFMESHCGSSYSFTTSFQLDSSTGITYKNLLDCNYTVTAPMNHYVVGLITRFELEAALTGSCVDYLDVHDGADITASKLNADLVCGSGTSIPSNFTSCGQSMTLRLVTDSSGVYHGFNIVFVAVRDEPCNSSEIACNSSICIDSSLKCDGHDQCGDNSDEDDCTNEAASDGLDIVMVVVIVLIVLAVIACVSAFVAYRIYERNRWKKFVNSHIDDDDGIVEAKPSYPITHKYYKGIRGHPAYYSTDVVSDGNVFESDNKEIKTANSESTPSTCAALT